MINVQNFSMPPKNLSEEQKLIAEESFLIKMLLLAGPGTGKTHTLIHRLKYLILQEGLEPYQEVLVLSFSRAAVAEIRSRVSIVAENEKFDDFRFLNVWTFDSFATRLLLASGIDNDLSSLDYDSRIALAVNQLQDENSETSNLLSSLKHVIVDEIQDLVGVRARLVQQILKKINGGFTLTGDPAQGIFDYLVRQKTEGPSSIEFITWVRENWKGILKERALLDNFRANFRIAKIESNIRPLALSSPGTGSDSYRNLRKVVSELESAGSIKEPSVDILTPDKRKVAVLCRTNAEALFAAYALKRSGLPAIIPANAEEKGLPVWIGRVLSKCAMPRIHQARFAEYWATEIGDTYELKKDNAWELLKGVEGREQQDLDLALLRSRLRQGVNWAFDSEAQKFQKNILVTTIHQAKGREYDQVVIIPSESSGKLNDVEAIEEARILYVAATRAKENLVRLERAGFPVFIHKSQLSGRQRYLSANRLNQHLFEVGVHGDIQEESFVNNTLFQNTSQIDRIQDLLWENILPGMQLLILHEKNNLQDRFILAMINPVSNRPIPLALMDNGFKQDLENNLRSFSKEGTAKFKKQMDNIIIIERKTIILPPYPLFVPEPYATSGFCIGLTVKGLIQID